MIDIKKELKRQQESEKQELRMLTAWNRIYTDIFNGYSSEAAKILEKHIKYMALNDDDEFKANALKRVQSFRLLSRFEQVDRIAAIDKKIKEIESRPSDQKRVA